MNKTPTTGPGSGPGTGPGEMTRLFLVPLVLVGAMVGCAALVVLLFGRISTGKEEKIESLLAQIQAATGTHNFFGGMWPKDKEMWQAAQELAVRLENKDAEIPAELQPQVARRLSNALENTVNVDPARLAPDRRRSLALRQRFLIRALGLLQQPESVPTLVKCLKGEPPGGGTGGSGSGDRRQYAAEALALMPGVEGVDQGLPDLCRIVQDRDSPSPLRMVCTITLSLLSERGDPEAIQALNAAYFDPVREVRWNAALALARLGDSRSKPLLREMLKREHWSADDLAVLSGEDGGTYRARLSPVQIEGYLIASIRAARALGDAELEERVRKLDKDPSLKVREEALRGTGSGSVASGEND